MSNVFALIVTSIVFFYPFTSSANPTSVKDKVYKNTVSTEKPLLLSINSTTQKQVYIQIRQHGIDLIISIETNNIETKWDAPGAEYGIETIVLPTNTPFLLEAKNNASIPGQFTLNWYTQKELSNSERQAYQLASTAGQKYALGTSSGFEQAAAYYKQSIPYWHASNPEYVPYTHYQIATSYRRNDKYHAALEEFELAEEKISLNPDQRLLGRIINGKGLILQRINYQLDDAEKAFARANELSLLTQDWAIFSASKNNLCLIQHHLGQLNQAKDCYQEAIRLYEKFQYTKEKPVAMYNLAAVLTELGQHQLAEEQYSLAMDSAIAQDNRAAQSKILLSWAEFASRTGHYQQAISRALKSIALSQSMGKETNIGRAHMLLGSIYSEGGLNEQAQAHIRSALSVFAKKESTREHAKALYTLSTITEDSSTAIKHLKTALRLLTKSDDESDSQADNDTQAPFLQARIHLALAQRYQEAGKLQLVENHISKTEFLPPDKSAHLEPEISLVRAQLHIAKGESQQAINLAESVQYNASIRHSVVLELKSWNLLIQAAKQLDKDLQYQYLTKAIATAKAFSHTINMPLFRAAFLSESRLLVEKFIEWELEHTLDHQQAAKNALYWVEYLRTDLLDQQQDGSSKAPANLQKNIQQMQLLKWRLSHYEQPQTHRLRDHILAELSELQANIDISQSNSPQKTKTKKTQLDINKIPAHTKALEYFTGQNNTYAWLIDNKSIEVFMMGQSSDINNLVKKFHNTIKKQEDLTGRINQQLSQLQASLIPEMTTDDDTIEHLTIIPDGPLWLVPFSALPAQTKKHHYLVEQYTIQYSHSLKVPTNPLPILSNDKQANDQRDIKILSINNPRYRQSKSTDDVTYEPLFHSEQEAQDILSLYPNANTTVYSDIDATRENIMSLQGHFDYAHIAVHGLHHTNFSALSGLALADINNNNEPIYGFLSTNEIKHLPWESDLTYLSSCDTTLGQQIHGEGVMSIAREFLIRGSKHVVASLWQANDAASAKISTLFFEHLKTNPAYPAKALREAQLTILNDPHMRRWHAVKYWASYTIQTKSIKP